MELSLQDVVNDASAVQLTCCMLLHYLLAQN